MATLKPHPREHPAFVGFYLIGGLVLTMVCSWLFYAGSHPPAEARHGTVLAIVLGLVLAPAGVLALLGGLAMHRAWRFTVVFQALPLIWVVGSAGLLVLLFFTAR